MLSKAGNLSACIFVYFLTLFLSRFILHGAGVLGCGFVCWQSVATQTNLGKDVVTFEGLVSISDFTATHLHCSIESNRRLSVLFFFAALAGCVSHLIY